jgi:segregation and condensation protein B
MSETMQPDEPEQIFPEAPLEPAPEDLVLAAEEETGVAYEPLWEEGGDLVGALEALFTAAGEVMDIKRLRELTGFPEGALRQAIEKLQERLQPPRGLRLVEVGGGWRMATSPLYADLIGKLVTTVRSGRLTPAQLEVLSIIAYRQPITQPEINQIRGVSSSANQIKSLLERELIAPSGRKPVVGRPMMYSTTQGFLVHFGLRNLHDLPQLADFGESKLEAQALAALEPPLPEDGLFGGGEEEAAGAEVAEIPVAPHEPAEDAPASDPSEA